MKKEEIIQKDEEILKLALKKPSFFGLLVDRYQDSFLRTAQKILNHKEEAEDAVQDSFVKLYLNANKFKKMKGASFKSWAYKILINTSLTRYKKLKREWMLFERLDLKFYDKFISGEVNDFESEADAKMIIDNILKDIPDNLRNAFKKYYLDDRPQKDIAREEKVSLAAIKMKLFRARRFFKKAARKNINLLCPTQD